ncbi:hypothetical protein [Synechococcus sp. C9]|nr:hypothetical protein [Synechococcus sp. C9]
MNIINTITIRINRKFHAWHGELLANQARPTAILQFWNFNLLVEVS